MKPLAAHPPESWRPNQRDYSERVLQLASAGSDVRVGLQGPCGCGKSIGYLRGLLAPGARKSVVLTTTRQHLKQLEETLEKHYGGAERAEWAILRGRSFYTCCGAKKPAKNDNPITREDHEPEAEWAPEEEKQGSCPLGDEGCEYRRAVRAAARAQVVVQCTIGGLYRKLYWGELEVGQTNGGDPEKARKRAEWIEARKAVVNRDVVVLDEAHEYLRVRRDFETQKLELWLKMLDPAVSAALQNARRKPGGYIAGAVLLEPESRLRLMLEGNIRRMLEPAAVEKALPAGRHLDNREEIKRRWIEKLNARLAMLVDGDVVSVAWTANGQYEKVELIAEPLYANVGAKLADVEIFTSATLEDIRPLLKIPAENFTAYPEIFDWDGHVEVNPLPDNAPGSIKNVALGADELEEIYAAPGRPLTIALFLSKTQAHAAAKKIARAGGVFVQGLGPEDLGELVELVRRHGALEEEDLFFTGEKPGAAPMLICYGGWVGTDLPGNKWLVIGSAPKTPISVVSEARAARGRIRNAWADAEKVTLDRLQLAQGLGRALRTPEDRAVLMWPANGAFSELGLSPVSGRLL